MSLIASAPPLPRRGERERIKERAALAIVLARPLLKGPLA